MSARRSWEKTAMSKRGTSSRGPAASSRSRWERPWVWQMWFDDPEGDPFWNAWSQLFFYITVALFLGNFFFVLMHLWACLRRRLYRLIPYAILSPLYWVLISLGAWKGFLQLFSKPFKWEKTHHGLDAPKRGAK